MNHKLVLYAVMSVGLLIPVGIDVASGAMPWTRAAVIVPVLLACLWCSWPRYRSVVLKQVTVALALIVMVNAVVTPLTTQSDDLPMLYPNHFERFEVDKGILAGLPQGLQLYSTNQYGHRTNRPIDYERKDANTLRVATFGASTTEGVLLDDQKTWPSLLGQLLEVALHRPVEVINTGVSGTRAVHHLAAFRQSEGFRLDVAIFMLGINDWNRDVVHATDRLRAFLDVVENWRFYDSVLWSAGRVASRTVAQWLSPPNPGEKITHPGAWYETMIKRSAHRPTIHYRPGEVAPDYAATVREIIAECRRRGIACLFLDQPTAYTPQFEAEQRLWMNPPFTGFAIDTADLRATAALYNGWLAQTVGRTSPSFCPLAETLPPTTDVFFDDCHFNENGARLVAKLVSECLLKGLLAPQATTR